MCKTRYREKLFHDSQQLLLSDAARELLGDAENNVLGEDGTFLSLLGCYLPGLLGTKATRKKIT